MSIPYKMIQTDRLHVARVKAIDGPKGILIQFFPTAEALKMAGVPEGIKLPQFQFVIQEVLSRQLAAGIVRQLEQVGSDNPGQTLQ